jgi:hypothetical protein
MRKAVIEIGNYVVAEAPTGGWRVFPSLAWHRCHHGVNAVAPISSHSHKQDAVAAAKQYSAGDERRARSA